jgi:hypothetical protein
MFVIPASPGLQRIKTLSPERKYQADNVEKRLLEALEARVN